MKTIMNYSAIILIIIALMGASTLYAQEWTKEQNAVWQEVENMWSNWKVGDVNASFSNVHEKYLGWNNEVPMPMSKAKWMNLWKENFESYSKKYFDIEKARILVHGNAAVVHYYYEFSFVYDDGEKKHKVGYNGKWAEFFVKENSKWMLIGDFTYSELQK